MKTNLLRKTLIALSFLFTGYAFSQDIGSETVEVVKPYSPSVNDAFKIKEIPSITDSVSLEKRPVQYSIFSVPVASTFSPAKGRATNVERERPPKLFDNYVTLAFGSYTSALAEFYSNMEVSRSDNFGIYLTHNSAQGGIKNVILDDHFYDTDLNLNYSSRNRNSSWNADFGVEHQLYNWYGYSGIEPTSGFEPIQNIDPQHNYYSVYAGAELNLDDSFFDGAEARYRYFGDDQGSTEHHFTFKPTLELPIGGEIFNTNVIFDYVGGSFDRSFYDASEGLDYSFLNVGLQSGLVILRDDLTLNLGAAIYYTLDSEESDSGIFVYPQVTASYRMAGDYFIGYAGLEGELKQNTYYDFVQKNPFVSPTLEIQPTDQQYRAYVGAKGKLTNSIGYNLRGTYRAEDFKPLFKANPAVSYRNEEDYAYGNSFSVVYDKVNTISAFGELNFDVRRNFNFRLNAEYFLYDTNEEAEAWNLPSFEVNAFADYQITKNWFAGANLFFIGERKDIVFSDLEPPQPANATTVDLESYLDFNANVGYRFNDRLSIFARGYNLFGENYEKWLNYPVMGLQVMAGATYKFNFGR